MKAWYPPGRVIPIRLIPLLAVTSLVAVCDFAPRLALAQSAQSDSVVGRPRPEYDPLGIRFDDALRVLGRAQVGRKARPTPQSDETMGSFTLNTTMELETIYDDNILRTKTRQISDGIAKFRPGLALASDWANHALNLTLGGDIGRYAENEKENYEDFNAGIGGKIDVDDGKFITLNTSWSRRHEERGTFDDAATPKPTQLQVYSFSGSYDHDVGDIFSRTSLSADYTDVFDNGTTNNDDRDLWTYSLRQRFGHEVDEGSQIFVEGAVNLRDYTATVNDGGTKLGSHGYEGLVGLVWDVSGVSFLEFGAGYFQQFYNESTFATSSGPSFRGRFIWNPTGLLTLSGGVARSVQETAQSNTASVINTKFSLNLDWEARYNLIVSANAGLQNEDAGSTGRIDDTTTFGLATRWLIGQNWSLRGGLDYTQKSSTTSSSEYSDTRFSLTLTERL